MKIKLEKKEEKNLIVTVKTSPFAGAEEVIVTLEIEKEDNYSNYKVGDIVKVPYVLLSYKDKLIKSSQNILNEWIKKNLK